MDVIRDFYADKRGRHPELFAEPRIREEDPAPESRATRPAALDSGEGAKAADHLVLVLRREFRVDRQREDRARRGGCAHGRVAEHHAFAQRLDLLQRQRVVHERRDAVAGEVLAQRVAPRALHDELVVDVVRAGTLRPEARIAVSASASR